jgi:hypothetical protein
VTRFNSILSSDAKEYQQRYFFFVSLLKKWEKNGPGLLVPMGCTGILLRSNQAAEYMSLQLSRSNKGCHTLWFYLKNDVVAPLLDFTRCLIEEAS